MFVPVNDKAVSRRVPFGKLVFKMSALESLSAKHLGKLPAFL